MCIRDRERREEFVEPKALLVALEVEEPEELVEMRVVQRGIRLSSSATLPTAVTAVERAISPVGGLTARGSLVHCSSRRNGREGRTPTDRLSPRRCERVDS